MNPFLRYLADKHSAHRQTHRHTDRHTPMTTRPCGRRRAGNKHELAMLDVTVNHGYMVL